jgi:FkbM family methyltransferase
MAFISYAQNLEDVMLYRALGHIPNGFYVDVGANDPVLDSVTKAFYDRGWSGINIEPTYEYFQKLANERPRDINLHCGTGKIAGELQIYHIPGTGLSTGMAEIARKHEAQGWQSTSVTVPIFPMKELLAPYAGREIHFLKIDVEGMEEDVIAGMDFKKYQPWILIIEAIAPLVLTPTHTTWEPTILSAGYEFVYNDGINRYYLANKHTDLRQKFAHPPNCFDLYETSFGANLEVRLHEASEKIESLSQANQNIRGELDATVKAKDAEAKAKSEIEKQTAAALQQLAELRGREAAMQIELHEASEKIESLSQANQEIRAELDATVKAKDAEAKAKSEIEKQTAVALQQLAELRGREAVMQIELHAASEKIKSLIQANQNIRGELDAAVKAREMEANAKSKIEKQASAALQQIVELRNNETVMQALQQLLDDRVRQMEQLIKINKLLEAELGTRRSLDEKMKEMAELGQINTRFAGEIKNLKEELLAARKQAFDSASRSETEIQRLRRLLYSASTGTHLYRAWHVLIGDKRYRQGDKTNAPRKLLKRYTNLRVPWHTHFYRGGLALFVKGEKPWHTHLYRAIKSVSGDRRYKSRSNHSRYGVSAVASQKHDVLSSIDTIFESNHNSIPVLFIKKRSESGI